MKLTWSQLKWFLPILLLLANLFFWSHRFITVHNYLTLAALDVGQGDALFIEDEVGHQILIDGGPDNKILSALPEVMGVTDRSLDLLILTHPHADHLAGLVEVLKRYRVGAVLESGAIYQSAIYDEWHRLLEEKKIPIIVAYRGESIDLAGEASLQVLTPFSFWPGRGAKNIHEAMVVTQLVVGSSTAALLTGDLEAPLEAELIASGDNLQANILKVGHHGSKTSTSEDFLQAVKPQTAVISVGAKNRYGHPHPTILDRLKHFGAKVLRTDQEGTIIFQLTGAEITKS